MTYQVADALEPTAPLFTAESPDDIVAWIEPRFAQTVHVVREIADGKAVTTWVQDATWIYWLERDRAAAAEKERAE